jgi:hypothetical protein
MAASPARAATVVLDDTDRAAAEAAWGRAASERGVTASPVYGHALPAGPGQVIASDAFLGAAPAGSLVPGTAAVGTYAWSGWADPIPRVHAFRERFRAAYGRLPLGHEQEGYDALRLLELALRLTRGRGGDAVIARLERFRAVTSSTLPIRLGPDDHTLVEQLEVGLFAAPDPSERSEAWVVPEAPWRPVMRTFTFDGRKTSILDRDRGPFFPVWHAPAPSPFYWRSRLGITTGPADPLH